MSSPPRRSRLRAALGLAVPGALLGGSCAEAPTIEITVLDPCWGETGFSFREASAWAEYAVVRGGCPSDERLTAGELGSTAFRSVGPASGALPAIASLPREKYGFAVLLRDDQCRIQAFGCTAADVESVTRVKIAVAAWGTDSLCTPLEGAGCVAPARCDEGRCTEKPRDGGADGGGGCDLSLVASGELPAPLVEVERTSGPTVAATTSGFVLAYREQNAGTGQARARVAALSPEGVLGDPSDVELPGCAGALSADSPSLAFSGDSGLLVAATPRCDAGGAGVVFVQLDAAGRPGSRGGAANPYFNQLSASRLSVAPAGAGKWEFVFRVLDESAATDPDAARVESVGVAGVDFDGGTSVLLDGASADWAMIARTTSVRAVLGKLRSPGALVLELGATAAAAQEVWFADAPWASLAAWSGRAAVLSPSGGSTAPPSGTGGAGGAGGVGGADAGGADSGAADSGAADTGLETGAGGTGGGTGGTGGGSTSGLTLTVRDANAAAVGEVSLGGVGAVGGAVTSLGDHAIVVVGASGKLTVHRVDGATGTLSSAPDTSVVFEGAVGDESLAKFDGTQLAAAASGDRVAVVWLTRPTLASGNPTGGWALLQCAE